MGQKTLFNLDGTKIFLKGRDINKDGKIDEIEGVETNIAGNLDQRNIIQPSDIGESLKQLNEDHLYRDKTSGIDMRSILSPFERSPLFCIDSLIRIKMLPKSFSDVSRQYKRLSVSQNGKGREQIVKIITGEREQEVKKSNIFKGVKPEGQ